jgi:hypothetical protein
MNGLDKTDSFAGHMEGLREHILAWVLATSSSYELTNHYSSGLLRKNETDKQIVQHTRTNANHLKMIEEHKEIIREHEKEIKRIAAQTAKERADTLGMIIKLGQSTCREFCDMLCEKLPAELRQQIYSHLVTVEFLNVNNPCPDRKRRQLSSRPQYNQDYVGGQVAAEIAEYCYRKLRFVFGYYGSIFVAPWLGQIDQHGFVRGDLVKHVEVEVRCGDFGTHDWQRVIDMLTEIKSGTKMTMELSPPGSFWTNYEVAWTRSASEAENFWDTYCVRMLKVVEQDWQRLRAAGLVVTTYLTIHRALVSIYDYHHAKSYYYTQSAPQSLQDYRLKRINVSHCPLSLTTTKYFP